MINTMRFAIIKKDIRGITDNKRVWSVMLIVPLVMVLVLPSIFIMVTLFVPVDSPDFRELSRVLGGAFPEGGNPDTGNPDETRRAVLHLIMNSIMPLFFLMIPVMASSVMAASAFVGEKEKRTLETLLYCPLSLRDIFGAKILASFFVSMAVSVLSFAAMFAVVETELVLAAGYTVMPGINWLVIMLLVLPAVSLVAINLIVRGSARAQSVEESQQRSVFLVLPIIVFIVGQFAGILMLSPWLLAAAGVLLAAIAFFLLKGSFGKFRYESLLR